MSFYEQKKAAKKALRTASEDLFNSDEQRLLYHCYEECQTQLTNAMFALGALSTGMVARNPSWKDNFMNLSTIMNDHVVGSALELIFTGVPIVSRFIIFPMQLQKMQTDAKRGKIKDKEFLNGASLWRGDNSQRDLLNNSLAFAFVYSRQDQIKRCTKSGAQQLGKKWVNDLIYSLLKTSHSGDPRNLSIALTELQCRGILHSTDSCKIEMFGGHQVEYKSLTERAGISYNENGVKKRAQLGRPSDKIITSYPKKFGFLHFNSKKAAFKFAKSVGKRILFG